MFTKLLSAAVFNRPPTSIRGKIMNLLGTIFRSGSIHIWGSNGCFQRRDGVSGSLHTLTVTLADVHLIEFGPRSGCKSTQPGIYQTAAPKGVKKTSLRMNEWMQMRTNSHGRCKRGRCQPAVLLKETCRVMPLADQRSEGVMCDVALPWQVKNKHGGHQNVKRSLVRH